MAKIQINNIIQQSVSNAISKRKKTILLAEIEINEEFDCSRIYGGIQATYTTIGRSID